MEGSSIDKQDHAADPCGQIGEVAGFDAAIAAGMAFARSHADTPVLVTADHGHTSQIIGNGTAMPGQSMDHTGTQVRIAGYGPQAANIVGLTDRTDVFGTLERALRLR
jgi:alkaline phosphatase